MKENLKTRIDSRTIEQAQEDINNGSFVENYIIKKLEYIFNHISGYNIVHFERENPEDSNNIILNKGVFLDKGDFLAELKDKNNKIIKSQKVEVKSKSAYIKNKFMPDDSRFRLKKYQIDKYIDQGIPIIAANRVFSSNERIRIYTTKDMQVEITNLLKPTKNPPIYGNKSYYLINDDNPSSYDHWYGIDHLDKNFLDMFISEVFN